MSRESVGKEERRGESGGQGTRLSGERFKSQTLKKHKNGGVTRSPVNEMPGGDDAEEDNALGADGYAIRAW